MDRQFRDQLTEVIKVARAAQKIDRERAQLFEALVASPAWKSYIELLNSLLQARSDQLMAPAGSIEGAIALEYVKGTMGGLIMARDLPSLIIDSMKPAVPATDGEE